MEFRQSRLTFENEAQVAEYFERFRHHGLFRPEGGIHSRALVTRRGWLPEIDVRAIRRRQLPPNVLELKIELILNPRDGSLTGINTFAT